MSYMFCGCLKLTEITFGSNFKTANVTDMCCMFSSLAEAQEEPPAMNLERLDVSGFDTKNVTNMRQMFYMCYKLKDDELVVTNFKTSHVTDMSHMFACYNYLSSKYPGKLTVLDLSGWDFTNVTSVAHMFDRQEKLDSGLTFPAVTNFASLTTMTYLFSQCLALTPATFSSIVSTWKFSEQTEWEKNIYGIGHTQPNKSMFGNYEGNIPGNNAGANYIFRETMTGTGKKFETRSGYTTADGKTLYIGGVNNKANSRLTTKQTL